MSHTIHYTTCPVCGSKDLKNVLSVKDHTVSKETFPVVECGSCRLRFTQDIPDPIAMPAYYRSPDYISHSNTSKGLINRLYQWVRRRTIRRKRRMIKHITGLNNGNLLDVGSGIGSFVKEMKNSGWNVTGLEPDAGARGMAKKTYDIELEDIQALQGLPAGSFDAITLWHVLEHVHELNDHVKQLKKLLKDSGKLFIAVPNYSSKDAVIYKEYWAAYDVPRHLYHFSPYSMKILVERNGLKIERYKPMWYDSFYISLLSSQYKNGKAKLVPSFWNGLRSNISALFNVKKCSSVIYIISKC